jgi:hypothetical protein
MRDKLLNHRGHREHRGTEFISLWLIALLFAACIPAQTPAILDATPGAGAVVTDDTYRTDAFSLRYPSGWRVITSQAGVPPSVTFVAAGDCALILVSSVPIEQPPKSSTCTQPDVQTTTRTVALESGEIALAGSAPATEWEAFLVAFESVAASVSVP